MLESYQNIPLLKDLSETQLEKLKEISTELRLKPGEIFVKEGEVEQRFFIIIEGRVEIIKKNGSRYYPLAQLAKGEIVGEMVLFENAPRSASAKTIEPSIILCFDLEKVRNNPTFLDVYAKLTTFFGEKISRRLRYTNEVTVEVLKERLAIGSFAVNIIAITTLYAISLQILQKLKEYMSNSTLVTIIVLMSFCYFIISMMINSGYPLKTFGLTFENWKKVLLESFIYTIPFLLIILLIKLSIITFIDKFHNLALFDPMAIFKTSTDVSLKVYFAALFGYIVFVPIQELIVRSGIQSALQKFLSGSKAKTTWMAIILSNVLFAGGHSHISPGFALSVFIPGIFWGWLYAKQNSLIGVSFSHILIGVWGAFIIGFENIF
ncbi:cyclic nucleotide-binding domain-containing protein [Fluviispira multicolorata]|uniref:Cyclic nucleotide-binding domain-containing protein n=1 Tax=Fluviispira multicolorata TaxID=2654512 RepID=A0A833N5M7_9BACT|nr:cyclic nucleotide-binding domain-containing protein [Fluviispira multicolorata]KAB8028106.1 cyclic nucleotide-binding domain-containing protein [Fluviispira multicolorata]